MLEELKIDPEFEKVIPPLTKDEYHQLEENILDDGRIMMPIAVWGDIIVDGHNRYRIAREYGDVPFSTTRLDFDNRYEAIAWICKNQLGRRNLSDEQKAYLLGKRYSAEKQIEKQRDENGRFAPSGQNDHPEEKLKTSERIAKEIGKSEKHVRRAEQYAQALDIADSVCPGIKKDILSGFLNTTNKDVIRTVRGTKITLNTVTRMLHNRRYIGEYQYRDVVIPNGIPAIVPAKLFEQVQERAAANKKAPAKHKAEDEYLLTTKLFCGYCQCLMTGESGTSHTMDVHRYYKCRGTRKGGTCKKKTIKKKWIEEVVILLIQKFIFDDVLLNRLADSLIAKLNAESSALPILRKQLAEIEKGIDNLVNAIQAGIGQLKADIERTFDKTVPIRPEMLKINIVKRFINAVVRIFAPML